MYLKLLPHLQLFASQEYKNQMLDDQLWKNSKSWTWCPIFLSIRMIILGRRPWGLCLSSTSSNHLAFWASWDGSLPSASFLSTESSLSDFSCNLINLLIMNEIFVFQLSFTCGLCEVVLNQHYYISYFLPHHRCLWSQQINIILTKGALLIFMQSGLKNSRNGKGSYPQP